MKHWELFLMFVIPTGMSWIFGLDFDALIVAAIGLFMLLVLSLWMYSIATWCNSRLPESRQSSTSLFCLSLVIPLVYVLMYFFFYLPLVQADGAPAKPPLWLLPMHMLSMLSLFYSFWFTSNKFKSLLDNEDSGFMIFSSTFFLLFIFPLGVWIIQPNVNKLFHKLAASDRTSE
ncbi:MAG: hypothetical protein ACJAVV_003803 [Alphaproteobacteria bacterium]|jgi:hypothetical protein